MPKPDVQQNKAVPFEDRPIKKFSPKEPGTQIDEPKTNPANSDLHVKLFKMLVGRSPA